MRKSLSILIASAVMLAAQPSLAKTEDSNVQQSAVGKSIAETKKRLDLSADQETQFSPVLAQHIKERTALLDKYGLNEEKSNISFRQLRNFRNEMLVLSNKTRDKVSGILNDEQLKEWDMIQEENRKAMRQSFSLQ